MALAAERFDYVLPPERIAQTPAERRDASRLMVVERESRRVTHARFHDLADWLRGGDRLFRNNAAVIPARLTARRPTGGRVECFLLAPSDRPNVWRCLLRPARKLPAGAAFSGDGFSATVERPEGDGAAMIRFETSDGGSILETARRTGAVPLPPYIARAEGDPRSAADRERYQTVYADPARTVAAAAPTAGLHFTPELFTRLAARGIAAHDLTLHVGVGTFRPISTPTVEEHPIHREAYEISPATQAALVPPLTGRRVAVGTTAVRTIEDFLSRHAAPLPGTAAAESDLYIYPPRTFRGVDALITNFHLPRSTLLCLVAAFLSPGSTEGIDWLRTLYAEALAKEYRFLSYGDAMLIL